MAVFISILFWAGIAGLVDGSLGLLFEDKWRRMTAGLNIRKIAWAEIAAAWVFLGLHFVLKYAFGG